jgi:hypothetical protein
MKLIRINGDKYLLSGPEFRKRFRPGLVPASPGGGHRSCDGPSQTPPPARSAPEPGDLLQTVGADRETPRAGPCAKRPAVGVRTRAF